MKFYFAGSMWYMAQKGLMSYIAPQQVSKIKEGQDVILDSGAFTAWSKGKKIDIDKYADYLLKHKDKFTIYANLDVIGNEEKTLENQKYLESKYGLKPLPTLHYGASMEKLKYYAENYDYIALGGLVPYAREPVVLRNWLNKCFKILMPYVLSKSLKIHGFGIGSAEILKTYPFYSSDSSGWLSGGKFGTVVTWDSQKMKMLSGIHFTDKDAYLKRGSNLKITGHYHERFKHNITEYEAMEKDITKLWEARGIKYE